MIKTIFKIIDNLQEQKEYSKCINLLYFLIGINPFIPNIWLHLGDIFKEQNHLNDALYTYLVAVNSAPFHLEPYRRAVNLCLLSNQKEFARKILEYGIKICEDHTPRNEDEEKFSSQLSAILTYVNGST